MATDFFVCKNWLGTTFELFLHNNVRYSDNEKN